MVYPTAYQPNYQQYYPQATGQSYNAGNQNQSNNLIWVQGEAGAKSYLVAPNTTVQLWDSESPTIYLKSADASGMPSMRILDYTFREEQKGTSAVAESHKADYVTHEELKSFEEEIRGLIKPNKKEVTKDE